MSSDSQSTVTPHAANAAKVSVGFGTVLATTISWSAKKSIVGDHPRLSRMDLCHLLRLKERLIPNGSHSSIGISATVSGSIEVNKENEGGPTGARER